MRALYNIARRFSRWFWSLGDDAQSAILGLATAFTCLAITVVILIVSCEPDTTESNCIKTQKLYLKIVEGKRATWEDATDRLVKRPEGKEPLCMIRVKGKWITEEETKAITEAELSR